MTDFVHSHQGYKRSVKSVMWKVYHTTRFPSQQIFQLNFMRKRFILLLLQYLKSVMGLTNTKFSKKTHIAGFDFYHQGCAMMILGQFVFQRKPISRLTYE